ncbi:hypothetical protein PENSPDRAFT_459363 [Peniophora sp. CONT]|nr:hypothetical protein PENSPDRAFT_459363 [Peniophora sp. CONT]
MSQLVDYDATTSIVKYRGFPLLLETFLYALYTVLTAYVIHTRWVYKTTTKSLPLPPFMLLTTLAMFFLFSAYWVLDVYMLWAEVYVFLPQQPEVVKSNATLIDGLYIPWPAAYTYFAQGILQVIMVGLGDTVSLWRAYVICGRPRWLYKLSVSIVVIESGVYILDLVVLGLRMRSEPAQSFKDTFFQYTYIPANAVTGCAQVLATGLIAYKAWVLERRPRVLGPKPTSTWRRDASCNH